MITVSRPIGGYGDGVGRTKDPCGLGKSQGGTVMVAHPIRYYTEVYRLGGGCALLVVFGNLAPTRLAPCR